MELKATFLTSKVMHQYFSFDGVWSVHTLTCSLLRALVFSFSPQLVHVLNMMSAKILTYSVLDGETVADLQLRIEKDTSIPAANQELLLEAGLALEAHGLATQCAIDYTVIS